MPTRNSSKKGRSPAKKKTPLPSARRKSRLGRGLDALLGVSAKELAGSSTTTRTRPKSPAAKPSSGRSVGRGASRAAKRSPASAESPEGIAQVDTNLLVASSFQPRRSFKQEDVDELAASIREHGILQPIVVRKAHGDGTYQIVAGERRWRAAKQLRLKSVPVVERDLSDAKAMSIALVENLQRVDLNPVEKARGIARLQEHCGMNQQDIARNLGCSRVAVTNLLRLLKLHPEVLDMLSNGKIQASHARALLALDGAGQIRGARKIEREGLSSDAVEKMVRSSLEDHPRTQARRPNPDTLALERELAGKFGAKIAIKDGQRGKSIVISCPDSDGLEAVIAKLRSVR